MGLMVALVGGAMLELLEEQELSQGYAGATMTTGNYGGGGEQELWEKCLVEMVEMV